MIVKHQSRTIESNLQSRKYCKVYVCYLFQNFGSIKPIKVKRNLKTTDTEYTNKICFAAKQNLCVCL